jgi:sialic acid synthase SpsE/mannose-6-phosphate isomerase-like protein (cupin superfamily)
MLIINELANNHKGDISRGKKIIDTFYEITKLYPQWQFAFKFQYRHLPTFIHPDYQNRLDVSYIKRFKETYLYPDQLNELINYAKKQGFLTICTPFDEDAVDIVSTMDLDYIKIASCSINDWPLLHYIALANKPVIASTGGASLDNIKKVVSFFENRQIPLSLMHCVGLYPSPDDSLNLSRITTLKETFPSLDIGFSTHERPDNYSAVQMAIAKGATIFEKHVDLEHNNKYSITPEEYEKYLVSIYQAIRMDNTNNEHIQKERDSLRSLLRGAYFNRDVKAGETINRNDLFFAMPVQNTSHLTAQDCSKYTVFTINVDKSKNEPLLIDESTPLYYDTKIEQIRIKVKSILKENYIVYPPHVQMEISHHYGLDRFDEYGMCMITIVNGTYCKKLLILFRGQIAPTHYHQQKDETFFILTGEPIIEIGTEDMLHVAKGDLIHIAPNKSHKIINNDTDTIIEELSSTHIPSDSIYIDPIINSNSNRKTLIYL